MKTPEDEAFEDIERKQGMWGGGFQAKRQAAMDKVNAEFNEEYIKYRTAFPKGYTAPKQESVQHWSDCAVHNGPAYPAGPCDCGVEKEPPSEWAGIKAILDEYGLQAIDFVADFKAALAGREWNFCERCGKRTKDLTVIHTCTPPQEGA